MKDIVILGSDTKVGKTEVSIFLLNKILKDYAYWKPIASLPRDDKKVAREKTIEVFPPMFAFDEEQSPLLCAKKDDVTLPMAREIFEARAKLTNKYLVIESAGGILSPLNDDEFQFDLIGMNSSILVSNNGLGGITRMLNAFFALDRFGLKPDCVILTGKRDKFVEEQILRNISRTKFIAIDLHNSTEIEVESFKNLFA